MAELHQWMKNFTLPLPVFILAGALLAIASNYGKYAGWSFQQQPDHPMPIETKYRQFQVLLMHPTGLISTSLQRRRC
jgi:hypothetical protein